jgi:DNA (cytosine-5)-methyltransferase 1
LNELALFAGTGGGILGGLLLGWRTVCAVELDAYARDVLVARQNDGCLEAFPVWDDVCTFDGRPWRGRVDVVSGGFPCQDISCAGKGAGLAGERSGLWREFARIIGEVRPPFVFVENSPMLTVRGLGTVLGDLAALGFDARWCVLGACDAGAPHKRDRIWIVGHARGLGWDPRRTDHGEHDGAVAGADGEYASAVADASGECEREPADEADALAGGGKTRDQSLRGGEYVADADVHGCSGILRAAGQGQDGLQLRADVDGEGSGNVRAGSTCETVADADGRGQPVRGRAPGQGRHSLRSDMPPEADVPDAARVQSGREIERAERQRTWQGGEYVADADGAGCEEQRCSVTNGPEHEASECGDWWESEPDVGRVADGVAARVDRLRAIGNGQVPAVAAAAWRLLSQP